jgi:hypothetical protein
VVFEGGLERHQVGAADRQGVGASEQAPEHASIGDPGDPADPGCARWVAEEGQQRRRRDQGALGVGDEQDLAVRGEVDEPAAKLRDGSFCI